MSMIASASDDSRILGLRGEYSVTEVVPGELYEVLLHEPGRRVRVVGYAYDEQGVAEKIREFDVA